jgi:hypothetical protein
MEKNKAQELLQIKSLFKKYDSEIKFYFNNKHYKLTYESPTKKFNTLYTFNLPNLDISLLRSLEDLDNEIYEKNERFYEYEAVQTSENQRDFNHRMKLKQYFNRIDYIMHLMVDEVKTIIDIIEYTSETQKITTDYLYSAYGEETDIIKRKFLWCSAVLDQALLHPFNRVRIKETEMCSPVIYRFNIKPVNIIVSANKNNINILGKIFGYPINKLDNIYGYYNTIKNFCDELLALLKNNDEIDQIFSGENNYRILIILDELNKIVTNPKKKIYGYYNYYDQNEYGLILSPKLLPENIIKTSYLDITYKNEDEQAKYTFPIEYQLYVSISSDSVRYKGIGDTNNMRCENLVSITYKDFDTMKPIIYKCTKPTYYNRYHYKKYLKYKSKYKALKMLKQL